MRWLWLSAYRKFSPVSATASLMMFTSLALKLGALGLLSRYIHLLETNRGLHLLGHTIENPRSSYVLLVFAAGISLLMFLGASAAGYLAERAMLRLSASCEEDCAKFAIYFIGRYGGHPDLGPWKGHFNRLIGGDARLCGTVARLVLRCLLPLVSAILTLGILVYLDWTLTATLMALVLCAVPLLYRINVRGASFSRIMERHASEANVEKRRLIKATATASADAQLSILDSLDSSFSKGVLRVGLDSYVGRLRVTAESAWITSSVMAFSVFVILIQKGSGLMNAAAGWTHLAAYLLMLRLCMSNLTQLMSLLAAINRLYPQFARYVAFSVTVRKLEATSAPIPPNEDLWSKVKISRGTSLEEEGLDDGGV